MLELLSNAFGAVMQFLGLRRESANRENTPEMQANAKSAQDAKTVDDARKVVAEENDDEIRKGLS